MQILYNWRWINYIGIKRIFEQGAFSLLVHSFLNFSKCTPINYIMHIGFFLLVGMLNLCTNCRIHFNNTNCLFINNTCMNVKMGRGDFFFFLFMPRYKIVLNILGSHIPTTLSAAHCPKFKIREQKTPHKISFICFSNELNRQCGQRISTFSSWSAVQLARVQCVVLQPNNLQYEVSFTTLPAAAAIPNSSNNKYLMCVVDRYFIFLLFLCRRIHLSSRLYDYQISM